MWFFLIGKICATWIFFIFLNARFLILMREEWLSILDVIVSDNNWVILPFLCCSKIRCHIGSLRSVEEIAWTIVWLISVDSYRQNIWRRVEAESKRQRSSRWRSVTWSIFKAFDKVSHRFNRNSSEQYHFGEREYYAICVLKLEHSNHITSHSTSITQKYWYS